MVGISFAELRLLVSDRRREVDVEVALDDGDGVGRLRLQHAHLVHLVVVHDRDDVT